MSELDNITMTTLVGSFDALSKAPADVSKRSALLALPVARLHITVRAEQLLQLPDYAGSMLRGAFGHALQRLSPLPHRNGQPCALKDSCIYCQIFATPPLPDHPLQKFSQMPPAYVVEPPGLGEQVVQRGEHWQFGLVLIGRALEQLPLVVLALQQALQRGLGREKSRCTLLSVHDEDGQPVWTEQTPIIQAAPRLHDIVPRQAARQVVLKFLTPLRLQQRGKLLDQRKLDARTLLITLARRWQLLADTHLGRRAPQLDFPALVEAAEAIELEIIDMYWHDWARYSTRQRQRMVLGGLLGSLRLHGPLDLFYSLLHLGQWLHVGKETAFGLGRYDLRDEQIHN